MDSLRQDDTAWGPLIRNDSMTGNSLNGLYLFAETNGYIEPTNAMTYPTNPTALGGASPTAFLSNPYSLAYVIDEPVPVIILAQLIVGQELLEKTGGQTNFVQDRLYIQPGAMLKFDKGSALDVIDSAASLNVGSRSYITGFDQNPNYSPTSAGFSAESANDPTVMFTSIYDDTASTPFVPATNVLGESTTPTLGPGMWGGVGIITGAVAVINAATFQYGGGAINTQTFVWDSQSVLAFITSTTAFPIDQNDYAGAGTYAYITNNNFYHNFDAAMQIEPNGLMAGDPLTPLESGHPFFRGNVMQNNGIDGMAVVTERSFLDNATTDWSYIGPVEDNPASTSIINNSTYINQTVNAVWDATDLTYVLRGTVVLGPEDPFFFFNQQGNGLQTPDTTAFTTEATPIVTLTIQAALPGTPLADGSTIPSPGQSVIVKMLNDNQPLDAGSLSGLGQTGSGNAGEADGAGFAVGVDNGVDPTSDPLIDTGVGSEIRILGIPGNQTTGQQRVPVILTSLRDDTVGTTVRGVQMYNIFHSWPTQLYNPEFPGTQSLTTPAAGDGGILYIGGNSLTEYDPTNPFDGSIISNADISYMTRIEVQGGGIVNTYNDISGKPGTPTITTADWWDQLTGYLAPVNQLNSPMSLTISDSNLADFSDAAVFAHPGNNAITVDWTGATGGVGTTPTAPTRSGLAGEPVFLFMYNDTISNSGQGVHINSQTGNDNNGDSIFQAIIENCTFYGDGYGIQTVAPPFSPGPPPNDLAAVEVLAMNNIFDGSSNIAVDLQGQASDSQLQYNLFYQNAVNVVSTTNIADFQGNEGAIYGNPDFVGPVGPTYDATAQDFELQPDSPAINAGRSEIGPLAGGNAIFPGTNLSLSGGQLIGTRTDPTTLPANEFPGKSDLFGEEFGFGIGFGFGFGNIGGGFDSRQIVTLPGSGFFTFPDEFQPVLTSDPTGYAGPSSNADTYNYAPITGVRDILGYIRVPDPNVPSVGLRQQPVHRHRRLPVRQPPSPDRDRRDGDGDQLHLDHRRQHDPVLHRQRQGGQQHHPADDRRDLQRADRPLDAQRPVGPARGDGHRAGHDPAVHQPVRQALLPERHQHPGHPPGRGRPQPPHRRVPPDPLRQRLAGHRQHPGDRARRRGPEQRRRSQQRRPAAAAFGQRLSRRQLLRHLHHQHHPAGGPEGLAPDVAVERHQHRGRRHHVLVQADVHRHDHRAQPNPRAARRPDGDPGRRRRRDGQWPARDVLRPQPAPGQPRQ